MFIASLLDLSCKLKCSLFPLKKAQCPGSGLHLFTRVSHRLLSPPLHLEMLQRSDQPQLNTQTDERALFGNQS